MAPVISSAVSSNRIVYEVVNNVDTPSDVTDPDTLSQASPVEHHPTASDEATCTTALQYTYRTDQHTTDTAADVTEGDTSQDVLPSYPHTIPSGGDGLRTVTIEELKERTKVTDSQLDTEVKETDMLDLADHFDNVETYPAMLGLSPAEQKDVKYALFLNDMQTAMFHTLKVWRQHKRKPHLLINDSFPGITSCTLVTNFYDVTILLYL
ncbi:uncharacterized protein LOC135346918 [Halichondria panicea]|uniref:uncharacterized protein LOC135346918 n=1 Tax=Halichondria panicea TaxID=6063 RepID=UPI00312BA03E